MANVGGGQPGDGGGGGSGGGFWARFWNVAGIVGTAVALFAIAISIGRSGPHIPYVTLRQGAYTGTVLNNTHLPVEIEAWLGIPYAKPPVGRLRFARPQPFPAGRRNASATEYGYICPGEQLFDPPSDMPEASEDCLTVNVFKQVKENSPNKQPVLVYIHGGAFNRGYASQHDTASMLAWSNDPFIAVSFNYRLGALGFLPSSVATKEGILNLGLRDQILLLEWVQKNIEKFGGDPGNVTVMGVSAGAHSIGHHIMNINQRKELFHKAIIESGGPTSRAMHLPDSSLHETQFKKLLVGTDCQNEAEDQQIQCLRNVTSAKIIEAQRKVFDEYDPSLRWAWQPSIDGDLISRRPIDAWKSGKWHSVPILTGFNHNEGTRYIKNAKLNTSNDFDNFFKTLLPHLTESDMTRLTELYPDPDKVSSSPYLDTRDLVQKGKISSQFKRAEAAYGQYAYVCPVRQTTNLGSVAQSEPIYLYHWALNTTVLGGANHADQMAFEAINATIWRKSDMVDAIAETFHSYIVSFILTGHPNMVKGLVPERPMWKPFDANSSDGDTMLFGEGNDELAKGENEGLVAEFKSDRWAQEECAFWWEKSAVPEEAPLSSSYKQAFEHSSSVPEEASSLSSQEQAPGHSEL